jgi:hypothetical protein
LKPKSSQDIESQSDVLKRLNRQQQSAAIHERAWLEDGYSLLQTGTTIGLRFSREVVCLAQSLLYDQPWTGVEGRLTGVRMTNEEETLPASARAFQFFKDSRQHAAYATMTYCTSTVRKKKMTRPQRIYYCANNIT